MRVYLIIALNHNYKMFRYAVALFTNRPTRTH